MKKLILLISMFMLSVTVNGQSKLFGKEDDVRVFMDGKTFYNSDTGLEIEYGAISSYNTYGITAKNKEGVAAYFINVDITIYGNRANLVGMNPDNGGKLGFTVYKDKLIVGPGEPQEMIFIVKTEKESAYSEIEKKIKIESGFPFKVVIGTQSWMTKNLNVDKFRNGEIIPEAKTAEEWQKASKNKQPAWCYYDNDPSKGEKYGKLYNWYAVNDPRGLAPVGYHIPTDTEWTQLTNYLGGENVAGGKMKTTSGWEAPNTNASNSSGFSGLPGGNRSFSGACNDIDRGGNWWSSSEYDTNIAWFRFLYYYSGNGVRNYHPKGYGFSVRCVKNQ